MGRRLQGGPVLAMLITSALLLAIASAVPASAGPAPTVPPPHPGPLEGAGDQFDPSPKPAFGVERTVNVPFEMSDGTELIGNLYYPTDLGTGGRAAGRFPVLITMTPYGMLFGSSNFPTSDAADDRVPTFFAQHGYIGLVVDVRGTGRSAGTFEWLSPQQIRDYLEIIDYAAHNLDGSSGDVGLMGYSYRGINQLLVGGLLKPGTPVKAMAPASAGSIYRGVFFNGGIPGAFWAVAPPVLTVTEIPPPDQMLAPRGADPLHLAEVAQGRAPTMANHAEWWANVSSGGDMAHEEEWWQDREVINAVRAIDDADVPVLLTTGPNDFFSPSALHVYAAFQNVYANRPMFAPMDASVPASHRYQLVWSVPYFDGDVPFLLAYELQWFDHWLKGKANGVGPGNATLHMQELGGRQRYVSVPNGTYPMTTSYTPFYLAADGSMGPMRPPSISEAALPWGPDEKLVYTSAPFPDGATVAGPIPVTVYLRSSSTDAELVATLLDVAPDGTETNPMPEALIVDGAQIASQRLIDESKSWRDDSGRIIHAHHPFEIASEQPLTPGEIVRVDMQLRPRLLSLQPGHRLRLVLSSQNEFLIPTASQAARLAGGTYQVQQGGAHGSYLNLPLLPLNAFPAAGDPSRVGLGSSDVGAGEGSGGPPPVAAPGQPGRPARDTDRGPLPATGGGLGAAGLFLAAATVVGRRQKRKGA